MVRANLIGICLGEHGSAHHHRHARRLFFQQGDGFTHGGHRGGHQGAQAYQPRAGIPHGLQYARGRHILAQISHGKAVIQQEHLDDVLADIVYIALNGSQHHAAGSRACLRR